MIQESFVYFDVGAASYDSKDLYPFPLDNPEKHKYLKKYVGIDPLFKSQNNEGKYHYYRYAVGKEEEKRLFYVTQYNENSSFFVPLKRGYRGRASVKSKETIGCVKLSTIIENEGNQIDILKLDTQGSELEILESVSQYINNIYAIHVEVWGIDYAYKDIPLFTEVHDFLSRYSFVPYKTIAVYRYYNAADFVYFNQKKCMDLGIEKVRALYDFYDIGPKDKEIVDRDVKNMLERIGK